MEDQGLFAKEGYKDSHVVVESIHLYLVEYLPKVFIYLQCLLEFEHTIFDTNSVIVLHGLKTESPHVV